MNSEKINLDEKFACFSELWSPKIVGELNGQQVKLAKLKGEFVWHHHDDEDEMFLIHKGHLKIELRDKTLNLGPGDFTIIPKGVEHKPVAEEECEVILFEPASTINTGNNPGELTKENLETL